MPLTVRPDLVLEDAWLDWRTSRSGGPGGQRVNKVETQVELRFDLAACQVLDPAVKRRLRTLAGRRLTKDDVVRIVSSEHREQAMNRTDAEERLRDLILEALKPPPPPRKRTRVPRAQREKRMKRKKQRAEKKKQRGRVDYRPD